MMRKLLDILVFAILLLTVCRCNAQSMDGNCHVEVYSGSPVLFQFNNVDEMRKGKTLVYNSIVRVFVVRPLRKWSLYAKSIAPVFDGPSTLNSSIVHLEVKHVRMDNSFEIGPGSAEVKYTYSNNGEVPLDPDRTQLASGTLSTDIYNNYALYFYIQFSIVPDNDVDLTSLTGKESGYYASQACFWFEYDLY